MQDVVDHTGQAFLGVTIGCARCHDHMYDPILQKEYYQVRAIFEPHQVRIDRVPGVPDTAKDGLPRAFDAQPDAKTLPVRPRRRPHPTGDPLAPGVPESLGGSFDVKPSRCLSRPSSPRSSRGCDPCRRSTRASTSTRQGRGRVRASSSGHRRTPKRSS